MSIENKKLTEDAKEMKLSDEQLEHIAAGKKHKHPYDGHPHIEEYGYVFYCTAPGITQNLYNTYWSYGVGVDINNGCSSYCNTAYPNSTPACFRCDKQLHC